MYTAFGRVCAVAAVSWDGEYSFLIGPFPNPYLPIGPCPFPGFSLVHFPPILSSYRHALSVSAPGGQPITRVVGACKAVKEEREWWRWATQYHHWCCAIVSPCLVVYSSTQPRLGWSPGSPLARHCTGGTMATLMHYILLGGDKSQIINKFQSSYSRRNCQALTRSSSSRRNLSSPDPNFQLPQKFVQPGRNCPAAEEFCTL